MVKNLPAIQDTKIQSLGQESPLKKGMGTHSNILTWRIPWTEEPGGLQRGCKELGFATMGLQRVGHHGLEPWGCKELDTTERLTISLSSISQSGMGAHKSGT